MKQLILILLLLITHISISQNFPTVKLSDESELKLDKLSVNVEISGNYAVVTYDMTFYNGLNRILEGELAFPLAQGQSVSHFAMDLNGKLRSAVVVEKELGRVAYENTIKQRIDPALLEQTQGNNYKARVYPIPAKGYKRIVVTYEQNLLVNNGVYQFYMPFGFKKTMNDFKIEIKSNSSDLLPIVGKSFTNDIKFNKSDDSVIAYYEGQSVNLDRDLNLIIPIKDVFALQTYEEYFHINKTFVPKKRLKAKPNSITILWDASYSMQYKKHERELRLIEDYIKYLSNVKVNLIVFSNTVISNEIIRIKDGNTKGLTTTLKAVKYDGGTSYKGLSIPKSDEILLFSDGLHNLGELDIIKHATLNCVNSVSSANHQSLEALSTDYGGNYINLNSVSNDSALNVLKHETFRFLGVEHQNNVFEVYPKAQTPVNESFNISGKYVDASPIVLLFGYGNVITERIKVDMNSSSISQTTKRLWAKNKLKQLVRNKKNNKTEIIELAKTYHLISPYTSMIVLDRIEDYVRYKIEPPLELMEEYNRRILQSKRQQQNLREDLVERKEELQLDYELVREWYNKEYNINEKSKGKQRRNVIANTSTNSQNRSHINTTNNNQQQTENSIPAINRNIDTTKPIVSGNVTTIADGLPLPGASVIIKGTNIGVQTDFDGNFSINAVPNQTLVISYVGMTSLEVSVGAGKVYNVGLEEGNSLDEVVVVGYSKITKESFTGSASIVHAENVEQRTISNITDALSGEVSGVNIVKRTGEPGSTAEIRVRGVGSINGNSQPLYILNGVPLLEINALQSINPSDIESMSVLKDTAATSLYGSRGANGVIIIITKTGLEKNAEEIKVLNEKVLEQSTLQPWDNNASYMEYLNAQKSVEDAYSAYLKIRENYRNTPSFFLDVADFFEAKNNLNFALRIATNLIEIELDNHELIRALAYKLDQYNKYDLSVYVYKLVLELRPEHPQSYRDLALAHEANGDFEEAIALFLKLINGELLEKDEEEMYYGIEQIAYVELCHLLNSNKANKYKELRKRFKPIETDIRVVVDWNHGETDLDLYIKNPAKEVVYYGHHNTKYGGRLSEDMTEGYGPESFLIKKAQKGNYEISVDYYSDQVQKITGPTSLKVTIYRNYGKSNEKKEVKVFRLSDNDSKLQIQTLTI